MSTDYHSSSFLKKALHLLVVKICSTSFLCAFVHVYYLCLNELLLLLDHEYARGCMMLAGHFLLVAY